VDSQIIGTCGGESEAITAQKKTKIGDNSKTLTSKKGKEGGRRVMPTQENSPRLSQGSPGHSLKGEEDETRQEQSQGSSKGDEREVAEKKSH